MGHWGLARPRIPAGVMQGWFVRGREDAGEPSGAMAVRVPAVALYPGSAPMLHYGKNAPHPSPLSHGD